MDPNNVLSISVVNKVQHGKYEAQSWHCLFYELVCSQQGCAH